MRIGILGAGLMGGKLGTIFARAGHEVVFSYARSNEKLKKLARDAKGDARAGTPSEAAKEADAVLLAVHWSRIDEVLKQSGESRRTCQEGSQGSCRLRVQHRAQRGAVRCLRGKKQEISAEPGVLR